MGGNLSIPPSHSLSLLLHDFALCSKLSYLHVGWIPPPPSNPFLPSPRGRKPQARALRRMVEAGFLDIATATAAMQQPLRLSTERMQEGGAGEGGGGGGGGGVHGPWRAPFFVSEVRGGTGSAELSLTHSLTYPLTHSHCIHRRHAFHVPPSHPSSPSSLPCNPSLPAS